MVSDTSYQVRAYSVKRSYDFSEFIEACRLVLQRAVDVIYVNPRASALCTVRGLGLECLNARRAICTRCGEIDRQRSPAITS